MHWILKEVRNSSKKRIQIILKFLFSPIFTAGVFLWRTKLPVKHSIGLINVSKQCIH